MYVVARRVGEVIEIAGGLIKVKVLSVQGKIARLGIEAPKEIDVVRVENNNKKDRDDDPRGSSTT